MPTCGRRSADIAGSTSRSLERPAVDAVRGGGGKQERRVLCASEAEDTVHLDGELVLRDTMDIVLPEIASGGSGGLGDGAILFDLWTTPFSTAPSSNL